MPTFERIRISPASKTHIPVTVVLSVGLDMVSLGNRNLLLRSAGYTVASSGSLKDAVGQFVDGDFDLVVLCHSIPQKDRNRLTCLIRATGSRTPIVCVSVIGDQSDPFADLTVEDLPYNFLTGVSDLLGKCRGAWLVPRNTKPLSTEVVAKQSVPPYQRISARSEEHVEQRKVG